MSVTLVFASASKALIPKLLDRMDAIAAGTELLVVCEFPPPRGRWIPYRFDRTLLKNYQRVRAVVGGRRIAFASVVLEPHTPYAKIRALALLFAPTRTLFFNENLDHFMLRPRSLPALLGHFRWRLRSAIHWQLHPGGTLYTWAWRLRHPRELRRPWYSLIAPLVGRILTTQKRVAAKAPIPPLAGTALPDGVSVVIPSRNGLHLLQNLLPLLERELQGIPSEVIVVDNGSDDGTAAILAQKHSWVSVEISNAALSFARAVNRGIHIASFSRVCLLNNDMEPHAGFFSPLLCAFEQVPELFCATAQIYFPEGRRREETGKAVFRWPLPAGSTDFPVHCVEPIPGENLTYVLYGSGGCSVFDTAKLKALGGIGEIYEPAYVEDLDAGFRAWQRGWPTVFVAAAVATHQHRATTSRYYSEDELDCVLEVNFLRFLTRAVVSAELFRKLWLYAVQRLTVRAAVEHHVPSLLALSKTPGALGWTEPIFEPAIPEEIILSLGNGEIAVFPGNAPLKSERVIIASCYQPFPLSHGGAVRMYNLMRRAASEYAQILITFVDELHTPPAELLDICVEVIQVRRLGSHMRADRSLPDAVEDFDSPTFRGGLRQTLRKWYPSIVQLEFTQMAQYAPDAAPAKTILVEHDITIDLYEQLVAHSPEFDTVEQLERWRAFEADSWKKVDCVVTMSNKDRRAVQEARSVIALPNGVDLDRFQPSTGAEEPGRILFIGSFAHLPNLLALDFFLAEVWPNLQSLSPVLHVIGGSRHDYYYARHKNHLRFGLNAEGVEFEGFVADVRQSYRRAALVIAPLLASAGTNIKILEAMAMGKAIVSTPAGVNGLEVRPGVDVLIERDARKLASAISSLLGDPARRDAIGRNARQTVEQMYSWDTIAIAQSRMYRQLIRS